MSQLKMYDYIMPHSKISNDRCALDIYSGYTAVHGCMGASRLLCLANRLQVEASVINLSNPLTSSMLAPLTGRGRV